MWREKVDQHNTGAVYERIERVIVERADNGSELSEPTNSQESWWANAQAGATPTTPDNSENAPPSTASELHDPFATIDDICRARDQVAALWLPRCRR